MVEKSAAEQIRDLGNRLAKINGLDNAESDKQQPEDDNILIASSPYGTKYEDFINKGSQYEVT